MAIYRVSQKKGGILKSRFLKFGTSDNNGIKIYLKKRVQMIRLQAFNFTSTVRPGQRFNESGSPTLVISAIAAKMGRLSPTQRKFVIDSMIRGQTNRECRINFRKAFGIDVSRNAVNKIMVKWNQKCAIEDLHRGNSGRPRNQRVRENFEKVDELLVNNGHRRSIRKVSALIGIPRTTIHRIAVKDLKIFPYKPRVSQKLNNQQEENRLAFCQRVTEMIESSELDPQKVVFSDESHIYLDDVPNRQNDRVWAKSRPDFNFQRPLHSKKVTVWIGMTGSKIYGPYFYETPETEQVVTVNSERYLQMLKDVFDEDTLMELCDHFFQQDGAPAHSSRCVLDWLETNFPQRLISRRSAFPWPANSPDLNPLDFYMWGYVKREVFAANPQSTADIKKAITDTVASISQPVLERVVDNFVRRTKSCIAARGGIFETQE